ncbi:PAS domain-containing protein [Neolewinella xylanilytica]|uniref:Oxygen sensor histidine kinase NreB n=1 Tax=Neolewinella xylanilytica TaxID=1514080 RepID=A0A2S6IA69_9BACT|nr:ATP-binding protein [Neolewinella xylanilytica]PPK88390.1 PAS domain-containing protein [Neolewinella xylanilytica]
MGENRIFSRLRRAYLLALSLIALALIGELVLVDGYLTDQERDAEIINVAGRQRMLSQRIAKMVALNPPADAADVEEWQLRHGWLKTELRGLPVRQELAGLDSLVLRLSSLAREGGGAGARVAEVDRLSNAFLLRMDAIVDDLSDIATRKVDRLQGVNKWLTLLTLFILFLELLFIFRPLSQFVRRQFTQIQTERQAQEEARHEAEVAVREKDATLRQLYALNSAIDEAALFASLRADGTVIHLSKKFRSLLGTDEQLANRSFAEILNREEGRQARMEEILRNVAVTPWRGEWQLVDAREQLRYLELSILPARRAGVDTDRFVLATDITESHLARKELNRMTERQIAEEKQRADQRARQTSEAQEKERLRVARDLHDGVGQNLTALKFSLESLKLEKTERNQADLDRLKRLAGDIIRGVRMATFNLRPPELSDYGLAITLERMARELSRLTGERVVCQVDTFDVELDPAVELNLYRITQEAVNNAIKYAGANYILVTLSAGDNLVSITVDDDGRGFDPETVKTRTDGSGLGLASMEERIAQLHGRLFIRSSPETGTRITINVPLPSRTTPTLPPG